MAWYHESARSIDESIRQQALACQNNLTKPPGALGFLEDIAITFSAWQATVRPRVERVDIVVMVADHGVAAEGVSAFPQAVTGEMVKNFATGGAAISVLARQLQARLTVINLGTVNELEPMEHVYNRRIAAGTANICEQPAMTDEQLQQALSLGRQSIEHAVANQTDLFVGGEMGIANSTSAACIAARLLGKYPEQIVGPGTGINGAGLQHKTHVVERALVRHPDAEPIEVLRCLGGFEIAALAGAYIACAQKGLPALLDGYISTAAALAAVAINPSIKPWLLASHCSAEPAHAMMLDALKLKPVLELSLRLGEGSGAALVVPIIQSACRLQSEMASFDTAGVSGKLE